MRVRVLAFAALLSLAACGRRQHLVETPAVPSTTVNETPRWDDAGIVHANAIGARESLTALLWCLWIPAGLTMLMAFAWERYHRRRARIEAAWSREPRLVDGPAVLQGAVETDGGDAITVSIVQRRKVWKDKNGNEHVTWTEKRREVIPRPFTLTLGDGRSVRVEPDARVDLRDVVEAPERIDDSTRRRCARLQRGERVWIAGVLHGATSAPTQGAYRQGAPTAVLRPPRFGRLTVSTEAPGASFTARADHHFAWLRGALITAAIVQLGLLGDFSLQAVSGRAVEINLTETVNWDVWVKPKNQAGRWVPHCAVRGSAPRSAERPEEHEVSCAFTACVWAGRCHTLPTMRAAFTGDLLRDVGRGPTLHVAQGVISGIVGWVLLLAYVIATRATRPWHAGGRVDN